MTDESFWSQFDERLLIVPLSRIRHESTRTKSQNSANVSVMVDGHIVATRQHLSKGPLGSMGTV
jgi:hypothetical protein